jgi:cold shock CspA family protein
MQGTMLWFNVDKGYGYIHTEQDERLYVARSGFLPEHTPAPRCKGRAVSFERHVAEGDIRAVNVSFVASGPEPRRARLRSQRGGRSI